MAQGVAVTWDNPDIHLESPAQPGVPVDSHALNPNADYIVVARIWNGSTTAPAIKLPVKVSYLEFGIGTTHHDIGLTSTDLGVKGAGDCPAFARVPWHTPAQAGHYCLQVELLWEDDANPQNNMGQNNTDVKALNPPHVAFTFPVRNDGPMPRTVRFQLDAYEIPPPVPCPPDSGPSNAPRDRRAMLARHQPTPIPAGWQVLLEPPEVELAPSETTQVTADITAADGYRGRQPINVHAYDGRLLVGGVTLYAEGGG
jgi:hypothetical protein